MFYLRHEREKCGEWTLAIARERGYSYNMRSWFTIFVLVFSAGVRLLFAQIPEAGAAACPPTEADMLGPFYKPDAPMRTSVGIGYILKGMVRSTDCSPVHGAKIELWLANPDGIYDDAHRATIVSDSSGFYRFESNVPTPYTGRPPHIHLRVSAHGFKELVTQHYPEGGRTEATFDLVLVPAQ